MSPDHKAELNRIIFGVDSPAGRRFDIVLLWVIALSVVVAMLDSVEPISARWGVMLTALEWGFTLLFTAEYLVRLWVAPRPLRYATSFFGIVDLLAVLPTYLALFYANANMLIVIRLIRVLRIFRVLKLLAYWSEANLLMRSLYASRRKILVFFSAVLVAATVFGSLIYVIEGPAHGFTSIPLSVYWAVITITTVGYGDLVPITAAGRAIATLVMLVGYSVIAVPTGILTSELMLEMQRSRDQRRCAACGQGGHESDARHCLHCGSHLAAAGTVPVD